MLVTTLKTNGRYLKATLLGCLAEAKKEHDLKIGVTYRAIMRRERKNIEVYTRVKRDPSTGWRIYSGKEIKDIIKWEIKQTKKKLKR